MRNETKIMRDVFIEEIYRRMHHDKSIFFLCADFGSPKLDDLRKKFKERFINVGIAEQNLINVASGLGLEGFNVYAYAIAPFLSMRPYEQIRNNLSLHSQVRELNINLVGVGAGLSYDVSGPTHHCLEDISIMRTLPNIAVFSPSDWILAEKFVDYSLQVKKPKYIRLDGKPLPQIYRAENTPGFENGFTQIREGKGLCLVSTGFMTHRAIKAADSLKEDNVGVIDVFMLKPFKAQKFLRALKNYNCVITIEEGFINKAGLDSLVSGAIENIHPGIRLIRMGFGDSFIFDIGSRNYLHRLNNLDEDGIIKKAREIFKNKWDRKRI